MQNVCSLYIHLVPPTVSYLNPCYATLIARHDLKSRHDLRHDPNVETRSEPRHETDKVLINMKRERVETRNTLNAEYMRRGTKLRCMLISQRTELIFIPYQAQYDFTSNTPTQSSFGCRLNAFLS